MSDDQFNDQSNDQTGSRQSAAGWQVSRRSFVHGSAAIAGAAALWGRGRGRTALLPQHPALRNPAVRNQAGLRADLAGGFSLTQAAGSPQSGNGSVQLILPKVSTPGTLLVATVLTPSASTQFTPPAGTATAGWQLGKAAICAGGRIEQWYWANNPGKLDYGSGSPAVFTGAPGVNCRGAIAEFSSPAGTTQVLDTLGWVQGTGYPTAVTVSSAGGVFAGSLGVFGEAAFFTGSPGSGTTWSQPSGYTSLGQVGGGVANLWGWSYDGTLDAGYQDNLRGGWSSGSGTCNGWAGLLCCYRAVTVFPSVIVGAEVTNCLDLDPTGQHLVVGGDVEGCWRTANFGDNWQPANYGTVLSTADQISFGDIKWSLMGGTDAGALYACTGKTDTGAGAFLASADGGCTWVQRDIGSPPLQFYAAGTPDPPRPKADDQDTDRTVNRLIAQDPAGGYLYLVTSNNGVMRSHDHGQSWTSIWPNTAEMPTGGYYPRCVIVNPANPQEVWIGAWASTNGSNNLGGVWHTANARPDSMHPSELPTWDQLGPYTGTVADLKVVGSTSTGFYLYAACAAAGLFRAPVSGGSLASLNGSGSTYGGPSMNAIDTSSSLWVSLDGFVANGNHKIIVGCSGGIKWMGSVGLPPDPNCTNVVKLTLAGGATPASYIDLTGPSNINTGTLPPFDTPWWHAGANWELWLGGSNSVNPSILVDPNNSQSIYVTGGGGGFFRSCDGGDSWQLAVVGMPMLGMHCFAIDPAEGSHFVHAGDDYTSLDVVMGDPAGNMPATIVGTNPGGILPPPPPTTGSHRESHAVCFDPGNAANPALVYVGLNTAYGYNGGGGVVYRDASNPSSSWTSTGYDTQILDSNGDSPAVTGLFAGLDMNGNRYAVAVAQGAGIFRWDGATWTKGKETDGKHLPGTQGAVAQMTPIAAGNAAGTLYCYDRKVGLYISTDYGQHWAQVLAQSTADNRTGWIAVKPGAPDEVWISTDTGLLQVTNIGGSGGPSVSSPGGGTFSGGAAGIAYAPGGHLYAVALPGTAAGAPAVTTLYVSTDDGGNWTDACNGDGSVGSYGPPAGQLGISSTGWLWAAGGEHVGYCQLLQS
ncbi:MAG TPA: hypothetical protein VGL63_02660 [Streptosporangiaceae bacterium]